MGDNDPTVLAQYRLGKTLGIGAFGKVKRRFANAEINLFLQ